jgi:hypothetical protein
MLAPVRLFHGENPKPAPTVHESGVQVKPICQQPGRTVEAACSNAVNKALKLHENGAQAAP